jgi:hypothetical protein
MLEALKAVVNLMGDEDLPDNGEFSGAAISDLVRSTVELALTFHHLSNNIKHKPLLHYNSK